VRLDAAGRIHIAGHTKSADFPVTPGAAQPAPGGASDCYLAMLSPDARRLLHATYLGGRGEEFAEHRPYLAPDGGLLLAGFCGSADFPTTAGAFQRTLGGAGDGFLTKLSADGKRWIFSTLLGGSKGENLLMPTMDDRGNIYVAGSSASGDFPVTPDAVQGRGRGGEDAVLAIFAPGGDRLIHATYFGGSGDEMFRTIALGPRGEVWLAGSTSSDDFPVTPGAFQGKHRGKGDAFVVKLVPISPETPGGER
jgi:hypothetical protein